MDEHIRIEELRTAADMRQAATLLDEVWQEGSGVSAELLRALAASGNYVVGLFDGARMIGVSAAFFGPPASRSMHSHITGIHSDYRAHGLGRRLKQHQRDWAFARDVGHITWTFDPLIARNAHFNLIVLGARVVEHLPHHYGADADRLLVSWALAGGRPAAPGPGAVVETVPLPRAIESMRGHDPVAAQEWRERVRARFADLFGQGLVIGGFRDEAGYLFVRP